jgi:hypothetical protein
MSSPASSPRPRIIDADVHNAFADIRAELRPYFSRHWQVYAERHGIVVPSTGYVSPVGVQREDARTPSGGMAGSDPAFLISDHLDRYGIDTAILTGSHVLGLSVHSDPDWGNAIATAYNQNLADRWLSHSPRFRGSIVVNHSDPAAAAKEIHRCAPDKRFVQVLMASGSSRLLGQRFYHPLYEAAAEHGLPVAIHPGTEGAGTSGDPTPAGRPTRYFEWHNIIPLNFMGQINSLVCEGVFEKFPALKFVAVEGGLTWLPSLMWRMDKNYKALRAETPWLKRLPSEYIREHLFLTTQPIEEPDRPEQFLQMLEMINAPKNILFSSDYPHWDFDNPFMAFPPLPRETKQRIFHDNAAALYRLDTPSSA